MINALVKIRNIDIKLIKFYSIEQSKNVFSFFFAICSMLSVETGSMRLSVRLEMIIEAARYGSRNSLFVFVGGFDRGWLLQTSTLIFDFDKKKTKRLMKKMLSEKSM